jgi:hypothetical protein
MTAAVLPFVSWLSNQRHRTAAHAFLPGRSLSLCAQQRRDVPTSWQPGTEPKCQRCLAEFARLSRREPPKP